MSRASGRRFSLAAAAVGAGAVTGLGVVAPMSAYAAGNTLTVDNSVAGCGTASGSATYCTIASAVKYAAAGDTVVVNHGTGTYTGTATVKVSNLTIRANGAVTISGGAHAFTVVGVSNVLISGFTVKNTTGTAFDLGDRSTAATAASHQITDGLHIVDNTVTGSGGASAGAGVTGTTVQPGVSAYYVTGSTFSGNHLDANNSYGLYLGPGSSGNAVDHNEASGNFNPTQRAASGIQVTAPGNTITGNLLHDNQDSGLNIYPGADHATVANNAVWHNGDHGIDNLNVTGGILVDNTAFDNCTAGINVEGTSSGYEVENNIAVANGTDTTCAHGPTGIGINADGHPGRPGQIRVADGAAAAGATIADHNLVNGGVLYEYGPAGAYADYASQGSFTAATGQGAHDIVADPGFANPGVSDFHIGAASPAVGKADAGAAYVPAADVDGKERPSPASLGAYEGGSVPHTPVASATITGPTGYAPNSVVNVNASGSYTGTYSSTLSYSIDQGW